MYQFINAQASRVIQGFLITLISAAAAFASGITVLTPAASDTINLGTAVNFTWRDDTTGTGSSVILQLYRGTEYDQTIISATTNDGAWSSQLPTTLDTNAAYRVKVLSTANSSIFGYSGNFRVRYRTSMVVTDPDSTDTLLAGNSFTIRWVSSGPSYVRIDLLSGTSIVSSIASSATASYGYYTWTIPYGLDSTRQYRIRVADYSTGVPSDTSSPFLIKDRWSLTITQPATNDSVIPGNILSVAWNGTNLGSYVSIQLYRDGSLYSTITSSEYNDGMYSYYTATGLAPGNTYQMRVASTLNSTHAALSGMFKVLTFPTLTVLKPVANEIWYNGDSAAVTWQSQGSPGAYVRVELYNDYSLTQTLAAATDNDGLFSLIVPGGLTESNLYRFKITSTTNTSIYDYSDYFYIGPKGVPVVSAPAEGSVIKVGQSLSIQWRTAAFPSGSYLGITLYRGNGTFVAGISSSTYNYGTTSWTVPASISTAADYYVQIYNTSSPTQYAESGRFTIDNTPTLSITSPLDSTAIEAGHAYTVQWSAPSSLTAISIKYALDQDATWTTVVTGSANDGSQSWTPPASATNKWAQLIVTGTGTGTVSDTVRVLLGTRPLLVPVGATAASPRPVLAWHPVGIGENYVVSVDTTVWFTSPLLVVPTSDTTFVPSINLPTRTIYWRVYAMSAPSLTSITDVFSVPDRRVPALIPVSPDPTTDLRPMMRWHRVDSAASYQLIVATSTSFSSPLLIVPISDTTYTPSINLPVGTIYWRVKSNLIDQFSAIDQFVILPDSIPILHAYNGDTVLVQRPVFSWRPVPGATQYAIQIFTGLSSSTPTIIYTLTDTLYTPAVNLTRGQVYRWRVSSDRAPGIFSPYDQVSIALTTPVVRHAALANITTGARAMQDRSGMTIQISSRTGSAGKIALFDTRGCAVFSLDIPASAPGYYTYRMSSLGAGFYILRGNIGFEPVNERMTIR